MRSKLLHTTLLLLVGVALCLNNGIDKRPPMGWNSWNLYGCDISEKLIVETINAMDSTLKKFGYQYVNIDDCWSLKSGRHPDTQELIPDPQRFPRGIKFLSDYAHSKGLKLGIYSDVGYNTCAGYPGSGDKYYEIDAKTFAKWGIDYLKLDYCNTDKAMEAEPWKYYERMSLALNSTGRPIFYSICNWGVKNPWEWAPKISNSWRTTGDIEPKWASVISILDINKPLYKYSGPYTFNDPDMLEVDVDRPPNKLTNTEAKTHFTLWVMLNSPLLLGNDIRRLEDEDHKWAKDILTNEEVISISQDPLVQQARLVYEEKKGVIEDNTCKSESCSWFEVWAKQLSGSQRLAVAVVNRGGIDPNDKKFNKDRVNISLEKLGLDASTEYKIRDLWTRTSLGNAKGQFSTDVIEAHDVRLFKISK
ncbi:alpha-galactosidase [Acrasis kona]|uniref:Alpha-galactosidase n=1 Tax=Acrasis kona TaxID=1008807 RepID=A0AAW2Z4L5_9EUKA